MDWSRAIPIVDPAVTSAVDVAAAEASPPVLQRRSVLVTSVTGLLSSSLGVEFTISSLGRGLRLTVRVYTNVLVGRGDGRALNERRPAIFINGSN